MVVYLSGNLSMGLEQCRLKMKLKKKITGSNSDVFFSSETEFVQSGKTQVTRGMSFYQKTFVDFSPLFVPCTDMFGHEPIHAPLQTRHVC